MAALFYSPGTQNPIHLLLALPHSLYTSATISFFLEYDAMLKVIQEM